MTPTKTWRLTTWSQTRISPRMRHLLKMGWAILGLLMTVVLMCITNCDEDEYESSKQSKQVVKQTGAGSAAWAARLPQDDYFLWQTTLWVGSPGQAMTADRCQNDLDLLQSDTVFFALRVPVDPPAQAFYTGDGYAPHLNLLDEQLVPATPVLTTALEYKPQYLTFAESELPAATGEHWLTMGAATSPPADCAGLPELSDGQWEFEANVWLDFGGVQGTCVGCILPLYSCYKGQTPPGQLASGNITSYQGWGITCLGPDFLTLRDGPGSWELAGQGINWLTATQTISFAHTLYNWTLYPHPPLTFTLETSSTLPAGWTFYADPAGQTPLAIPIRVDDYLEFWVFGQAPAGAADGPYELFVTAHTEDAPPSWQTAADLLWLGDWVTPPPLSFEHRVYLPLVVK
jgi:hypothetical protein